MVELHPFSFGLGVLVGCLVCGLAGAILIINRLLAAQTANSDEEETL